MQIKEIQKIAESHLRRFADQHLLAWTQADAGKLTEFSAILSDCRQGLESLPDEGSDATVLWQEVEKTIQQISDWVVSQTIVEETNTNEVFLFDFQTSFLKVLDEIPKSSSLKIPKNYWLAQPEDSLRIKTSKLYTRLREMLRKIAMGPVNAMRWLLRKPANSLRPSTRRFSVHLFLKGYCELPFARFLLSEWERSLQYRAGYLHHLHTLIEELLYGPLGLSDLSKPGSKGKTGELMTRLDELGTRIGDKQGLEQFRIGVKERLDVALAQITSEIEQNWQRAGTTLLPAPEFSNSAIEAGWQALENEFGVSKQSWLRHVEGEKEDWKKDNDLAKLQVQATQICMHVLITLKKKVNELILPALSEMHTLTSKSLDRFQKADLTGDELEQEILAESRTTIRSLRRELLPKTMDSVAQSDLVKLLENYASRIQHAVRDFPDQHSIFQICDLDSTRPESKSVDIALKDLVLQEIHPQLIEQHQALIGTVTQQLDKFVRDISEIDQIIEFNLEAALERLEQQQDPGEQGETKNDVLAGLERAQNRISDLIEQSTSMQETSQETLLRLTSDYKTHLQDLADNEKILELRLRMAKAKTREELREYRRKSLNLVRMALPRFFSYFANLIKRLKDNYLKLRKVTGLTPVQADTELRLSEFITNTQLRIEALPFIYQRLFRTQPLEDERFFETRTDEMASLRQAYTSWQSEQYGVTALVGEKGSGRTSLLNFACKKIYQGVPVTRIELKDKTISGESELLSYLQSVWGEEAPFDTLDDFERQLIAQDKPRIVIVEDLQNLFLRTVSGFEALERFLLMILRTHKTIYWVITCTVYTWRYLEKAVKVSKYFHNIVFLTVMTQEDIEKIVLKRHRVSGYKLRFDAPDDITNSKKFKKLETDEARQDFLRLYYFAQLNELSAGNITVTMMFWLSAIEKIEGDTLLISLSPVETSFLNQLPLEELLTLAALIQHEMLSPAEHAAIFNQETHESGHLLKRMNNRGILFEKKEGRYQVNFLLYRAAVRALTMKNILH